MAEILWDKKTGTYDLVDSNYLTPEPHAIDVDIHLEIDIYSVEYDWGMFAGAESAPPHYEGQLKGQVTSANFTIDSTSDMRSTCSLSIILDEDSPFIVHSNDYIFWQQVWLKITKKYDYINNIDDYPMFNWGDRTGLWNNNGIFRSDPSQMVIGWFVPNDGSFSYNAETREFTLSCTDLMSFLTDARGGHLSPWEESHAGVLLYTEPSHYKGLDYNFYYDKANVAQWSSGIVLEGSRDLYLEDKAYPNYLSEQLAVIEEDDEKTNKLELKGEDGVSALWLDDFKKYKNLHPNVLETDSNFTVTSKDTTLTDTYAMLMTVITDYTSLIPIDSVYINLQNDFQTLPYDLEFNGDTTIYDVVKKVIDLYPRQTMYFDSNRRLNLLQKPCAWGETVNNTVDFRAREFSAIVMEEHWNVDLSNIYNYVVVFGRDNTCHGYYYITTYQAMCPNCGHVYCGENINLSNNNKKRICKRCEAQGFGEHELRRLFTTNQSFCVEYIGTHKKVVYDDNLITEEECFNAAKAIALESCRAKKTLSVTLVDRYFSMYQWADKGVGRRIEYKSKLTGETDVYTVLKWTNDFNSGTVTLELEPYYTCRDEYTVFSNSNGSCYMLPLPEWTYTLDENGLLTMYIHNGWFTKHSLFKIYYTPTDLDVDDGFDFWHWSLSTVFLGETCEVYKEETETEHQVKVFKHQFTQNGKYLITAQAWSPNIHPSSCPNLDVIEVNCFKDKLLTEDGSYIKTEDDGYLLHNQS